MLLCQSSGPGVSSWVSLYIRVKIKPPGYGPQVLVPVSIRETHLGQPTWGNPFGATHLGQPIWGNPPVALATMKNMGCF